MSRARTVLRRPPDLAETTVPLMDNTSMRYLGSVQDEPGRRMRFMKRRRVSRLDRNGDPLDGIVNLFDAALVLAVGFLVMALAGLGISGVLTSDQVTIVTDPGTPDMKVVMKNGDEIKRLDAASAPQVSGLGSLLGSFYQLADGTVVYVPATSLTDGASQDGAVTPTTPGVVPAPAATSTSAATMIPTPQTTPMPTVTPPAPGTGVTVTPAPVIP